MFYFIHYSLEKSRILTRDIAPEELLQADGVIKLASYPYRQISPGHFAWINAPATVYIRGNQIHHIREVRVSQVESFSNE